MAIYELDDIRPQIADSAWVADNAIVIGDVQLGDDASVWFGCVLRGDTEPIKIGRGSNIQESTTIHCDREFPATIGENVTVGHHVMLHGCTIGDGSLIGIQAVVLNGARVGRHCLVGAGSLVTEGFADHGSPAKVVRSLHAEQIESLRRSAAHYVDNARRYRDGLRRLR